MTTGTEVANAAPKRQLIRVEDAIPLLDTARFEHMMRIATVMANSSLAPEHLRAGNFDTTLANMFLVVNQAVRWEMDPFAVAQSVFVLHGKIGYEGKLVAAVIEHHTGSPLDYEWEGTPGTDAFKITVTGSRPSDGKRVSIDGTVGDWKTFEKDGKTVKQNWRGLASRNQIAYRGAREWARLFAPALMLGVYTADEIESIDDDIRFRDATHINEPPAPKGVAQSDDAGDAETAKPGRKPRKPKEPAATGNQYQGGAQGGAEQGAAEAETVAQQGDQGGAQDDDAPAPKSSTKAADPKTIEHEADEKPDEGRAFIDSVLADVGPNKPLKDYLGSLHSNFAGTKSIDELKMAWGNKPALDGATKTEKEFLERIRDWHKARIKAADDAAAADDNPPAPGGGGKPAEEMFDFPGFIHALDVALGAEKTAADVNRVYAQITTAPINDGVVTEQEVSDDIKPILAQHLERVSDFGN